MKKKTAAVICEFNPFHTGHAYLLHTIKKQLGFERLICFMSGNYVQRGQPAVMDKYLRAEDALRAGADLVLELPMPFSVSSSGWFAHAAISMILKSEVCTHLVFGIEPGVSMEKLIRESRLPEDSQQVREKLHQGMRYADAVLGSEKRGSNELLALSYLKALHDLDQKSHLTPLAVTRKGDTYNAAFPLDTRYSSATAIRKLLKEGSSSPSAAAYLPFPHPEASLCFPDSLSILLNEKLLLFDDFTAFWDVPSSLSGHLLKTRYLPMSFSERTEECLHSCYSRSRISRALVHIALGIRTEKVLQLKDQGYVNVCRALAYRSDSGLMKEIRDTSVLQIETKNARFYETQPDALYYDQIWHILTGTMPDHVRTPFIL